jgi:hypothetical protein
VNFALDIMNESEEERTLNFYIEWEYVEGIPDGFDVAFPVWLDVKGNCLESPPNVGPQDIIFNSTMKYWWSPKFTGDLFLMVPHIHDGNTKQEIYMDGKMVCESIPAYGETEEFITHVGMFGHEKEKEAPGHEHEHEEPHEHPSEEKEKPGSEHDHNSSDHVLHVSSISQCQNIGKVGPENKLTITSFYDMTKHTAMKDHDGELEKIMGIEFLYIAVPKEVAFKVIADQKPPSLQKFLERVGGPKTPA